MRAARTTGRGALSLLEITVEVFLFRIIIIFNRCLCWLFRFDAGREFHHPSACLSFFNFLVKKKTARVIFFFFFLFNCGGTNHHHERRNKTAAADRSRPIENFIINFFSSMPKRVARDSRWGAWVTPLKGREKKTKQEHVHIKRIIRKTLFLCVCLHAVAERCFKCYCNKELPQQLREWK